jgi:hypothetical protein
MAAAAMATVRLAVRVAGADTLPSAASGVAGRGRARSGSRREHGARDAVATIARRVRHPVIGAHVDNQRRAVGIENAGRAAGERNRLVVVV